VNKIVKGMPFADYRARWALSSTMVSTRARLSWRHAQTPKESPELSLGRVVHSAALTPNDFAREYVAAPPTTGILTAKGEPAKEPTKTKAYEALMALTRAEYPGTTIVPRADYDTAVTMAGRVRREAADYLQGDAEVSIFFEINGVACKSRLDLWDGDTITELKTTWCAEPGIFAHEIRKWGYASQMAWQGMALAACGVTPKQYIIIAVESAPPWGVSIHRIANNWISQCEVKNLEYVDEFSKLCKTADAEWPCYGPGVNIVDFSEDSE